MVRSPWTVAPAPCQTTPVLREGGLRVRLDVEQLGRAEVLVPRGAAGLDAGHLDDDLDRGVGGPLGEAHGPLTSVNRPRTFVIMKWRPTKATSVWPGSMVQVPAAGRTTPSTVRVAVVVAFMGAPRLEVKCVRTHI